MNTENLPLAAFLHTKAFREAADDRFGWYVNFYLEATNLQIGFPLEENFSSYSVMTFP